MLVLSQILFLGILVSSLNFIKDIHDKTTSFKEFIQKYHIKYGIYVVIIVLGILVIVKLISVSLKTCKYTISEKGLIYEYHTKYKEEEPQDSSGIEEIERTYPLVRYRDLTA